MTRSAAGAARRVLPVAVLVVGILTGIAASRPAGAAASPEGDSAPRRVAVNLEFLAVKDGSRVLTRAREILEVGMRGDVEETVVRRAAGDALRSHCRIAFTTAPAGDDRVRLHVFSEVRDASRPDGYMRERRFELAPGTSSLVEIAPQDEDSEGLVVSFTVTDSDLERLTGVPVAVELLVGVYVVDGDREMRLQQPRLRTLAGSSASFSFDYPVPATADGGVDHVRFDVRLNPGHPVDGILPVDLALDGRLPGPSGGETVDRKERRELTPGQRWSVPVRSRQEDGPGLRLEVVAFWRDLRRAP